MRYLVILSMVLIGATSCRKEHDAEAQAEEDEQIILDYIASNSLTAQSTSSGLYYVINDPGTGTQPTINDVVTVDYRGELTDGSVFDQTNPNGATFSLQNVIEGWQEGIPLFKEGGDGLLLIPSALGYGPAGTNGIPPNSVLIFEVKLLDVE